jgi:LytS/YehU family sensor histidine kinase
MVPNLVLQPLVENSIRHGIGRRSEPGWIAISVERCVDTLVLRITDNGAGFNMSERPGSHQGMGLGITRGRLESLYGLQQSLVVRNLPAGGVEARITMPFRAQTIASISPESGNNAELQSADRG